MNDTVVNKANNTEASLTEAKVNKSVVKDRTKYVGGNNGDELALALSEYTKGVGGKADEAKLMEVASVNGIAEVKGGNVGMKRMNLGNMLRSRFKKGTAIIVGDKILKMEPAAKAA